MNTAGTLSGVWRCCRSSGGRGCWRSLREGEGVGSTSCGEEEVLMMAMMTGGGGGGGEGGKEEEEDKFLVPVIEDDFDWFRLSIAYLEEEVV